MTLKIPKPGAPRRADERAQLAALFDAVEHLPTLVARLSSESMAIDEAQACRWAGWLAALRGDPGWELIAPALDSPAAWPDVWHRARQAGFSAATEHHSALFFTRHFERSCQIPQYELARQSWSQALRCWAALADGKYLGDTILAPVLSKLSAEQVTELLQSLLADPLDMLRQRAMTALRLSDWSGQPTRRPLRFVLACLDEAERIFGDDDNPSQRDLSQSDLGQGIIDGVARIRRDLNRAVIDHLERRIGDIDPDNIDRPDLLALVDGAFTRCQHLEYPAPLDRALLRRGLSVIWDLRDISRDEELDILPAMLARLEPCTQRLRDGDDREFFGLEGAVADLLVFKGEQAIRLANRQQAFEEALDVCPGHRNASRLLSYLLLERANRELLKTSPLPNATASVGPMRRRLQPILRRARQHIEKAAELYPENDLIDQYRADLKGELNRFNLDYS